MSNGRSKIVVFGKHQLVTPTLFASYRMGDYPTAGLKLFPWDFTETEAILINAYDFKRPKYEAIINNGWSPSRNLEFNNKPILIDSGAYYFRKTDKITVAPEDILDLELKSRADIGVVLDHPFPPDAEDKAKRINNTVNNTAIMLRSLQDKQSNMQLMPVVHGHTTQQIIGCITRLRRVAHKETGSDSLPHVGIGSVAPLAQGGNVHLAGMIIQTVRNQLPDSHIHCFSMGSALLMLLAFYCGADTVDSQSWILSAAFKYAQLPGHYVMRLANRVYETSAAFDQAKARFAERIERLHKQEGFCAKNWLTGEKLDFSSRSTIDQYVDELSDTISNEHVHNRACHNLWVYNFEIQQAREALEKDQFEKFIEARLQNTKYMKAFEYARSRKRKRTN